ncbi:MAG TPA: YihY/virulence factor BrkB family protein [Actinomycetota bacterium]
MTWPAIARLDRVQRARPWLAFPVAVAKKFGDDRAGSLAALIAYYGFFSLFPLLMVLVTLSDVFLRDRPEVRERLLSSALAQFPVIGDRIAASVTPLHGTGWVIAIGTVTAVWAGLAGVGAAQRALDDVWDVPRRARPAFLRARLRALAMLVSLGTFVIAAGVSTAAVATLGGGSGAWFAAAAMGTLLNATAAFVAFRVLTVADVPVRAFIPGALFVGISWTILQTVGGSVVDRQVRGASDTYGTFAVVIGLLGWIYLAAQVFLIGAEVNVVEHRRLWPRRLFPPPLETADRRAIVDDTVERSPRPEVDVRVRFRDRAGGVGGGRGG